jgi:class 3 adenylate cyclase
MPNSLKERVLKLGIKTKLSLLTAFMILTTLTITLTISSIREVRYKKEEAKKLMINLGKQIGLMKSLEQPLPKEALAEYLEKTVHSSLSRKGYSIAMVYLMTTTPSGQLEHSVFNWKIIQGQEQDSITLGKAILEGKTPLSSEIQNVNVEIAGNEKLYIGFSMKILESEILAGLFEHFALGFILILFGVLAAIGVANKITQPLFKLVEGFKQVSKGNFQTRVEIKTRDELEQLSKSFNQMTVGLKERELIKDIFRRYATDQVVQKILEGEVRPTLSGERREITVLFSDIRMFTSIASKLRPEEIVYILNKYFTAMTEVVIKNEGLIDKFTGDEMMVVFGAPIHYPDDPQRALSTAKQMFQELGKVNQQLETEGYPKIEIGIGINTGIAVAGNIGSEKRMAYTVIGQDVNLAARLVSLAQKGEICLSASTYEKVKDSVQATAETVTLKGLDMPLTVYRFSP